VRSVHIRTPARLHFGLFADGRGERKFGGVGLRIEHPGFLLKMRFAEQDDVHSPMDLSLGPRVEGLLTKLRKRWDLPPVRVVFEEVIPHHVGLGSGTQLALAVGDAAAQLLRIPATYEELAVLLGRGARSGIGFHAYRGLDFIIDDGKCDERQVPDVLSSAPWPFDWPVVLLHPPLPPGLHGGAESDAFRDRIVIPEETSRRLHGLAVRDMAPAVRRENYSAFAQALYEYNRLSGACFAELQGGAYASPLLEGLVEIARKLGCPAVGQSSWGPTLFTIHRSHDASHEFLARLATRHPELEVTFARAGVFPIDDDESGTRLLVSGRSVEEAADAYRGGADIIDVKEPTRGPLGAADETVRDAVAEWWHATVWDVGDERVRMYADLSFALGELGDEETIARVFRRQQGLAMRHFWKIGFAGERRSDDWDRRFLRYCTPGGEPPRAAIALFVPVAYADAERADAPSWREIVDRICMKQGAWRRLLVDTFNKSTNFWGALGGKDGVRELFDVCEKDKIHLALAGSLKADDIDRLADEIGKLPSIIAVRGAACKDGIRTNPIDRERVLKLRRRIIAAELRLDRRGLGGCCR